MLKNIFKNIFIAISGIALFTVLSFALLEYKVKDKIFHSGEIVNLKIDDLANCKARLIFNAYDRLLKSTRIANVDIINIAWKHKNDSISDIRNEGWNLYFKSSETIKDKQNLGTFSYKISFYPVFKHIIKYYIYCVACLLIISLLWRIFTSINTILPPPRSDMRILQNR